MKTKLAFAVIGDGLLAALLANAYLLLREQPAFGFVWVALYLAVNGAAGFGVCRHGSWRLRVVGHGGVLLAAFSVAVSLAVPYHIWLAFFAFPSMPDCFWRSLLLCVGALFVLFWNGILCVYLTSVQLGIKQRVIGLVCGMIPIANLIALGSILRTVFREVVFETERERINETRRFQRVCETRYPLLLVHGVFFRDTKVFNYWGRIPSELEKNGATVYYGNHASAASVADSAAELAARIRAVSEESGCDKVNIIAHSKGGLDCRYALAHLDVAPCVASLTTVNTPHRGCRFADYLLKMAPVGLKERVAAAYNATLRKMGEDSPDFIAAVSDLTASACVEFDRNTPSPTEVFCQSVGSVLPWARGGQFPLNFSYHLVKLFDGENDGLVSECSFAWGETYTRLTPTGKRGISHGDVIDLNRQNIDGFDVREFYVKLVSDLKERGL